MIDITDPRLTLSSSERPRTLLVNPRWNFKSYSANSTHVKGNQWTPEELMKLDITKYGRASCLVILMMTPTALATGAHIPVCNAWKRYPQTVGTWKLIKPNYAGSGYLNDSCAYFLICRSKDKPVRSVDAKVMDRCIEAGTSGTGMSYGKHFFKYIEQLGNGPFLQVFGRDGTIRTLPKHWYHWEPSKEELEL